MKLLVLGKDEKGGARICEVNFLGLVEEVLTFMAEKGIMTSRQATEEFVRNSVKTSNMFNKGSNPGTFEDLFKDSGL